MWIAESARLIYPDASILLPTRETVSGGSAAATVPDAPVRIAPHGDEQRLGFVEVRQTADRRLTTVLELLSPDNKVPRAGRELYQRKQSDLRDAGVHLVEIDLLRTGPHVLEIPEAYLSALDRWDYLVHIARRPARDYELYPIRLRQRLPRVAIPLREPDADEALDLQACLNAAYDVGPYDELIDYSQPPIPPLAPDDEAWRRELLADRVR